MEPAKPAIPVGLLDRLLPGPISPQEFETMFLGLKKAILEGARGVELTHHLGYGEDEVKPEGQSNQRNGASAESVITDDSAVGIDVLREREGT